MNYVVSYLDTLKNMWYQMEQTNRVVADPGRAKYKDL